MDFNPGVAWESVKLLSKGQSAHHKKPKTMAFRRSDGSLAQNDEEQMEVLETHFQKVFNNKREVKFETLNSVLQRDIMHDQDRDVSFDEFEKALDGLANNKAAGENGVSPNAIKALNDENRRYIFHFIVEFWEDSKDYESWHSGLLVLVHKAGKEKSDPNNWRGINLMDVISKVMSRIMNERLFKILDKHGTRYQFGGTPGLGCREGIFTLKTLLHTRRNHNLSTHVAFIDLVKAYDTANHKLLIKVLEKYGVPPKLCSIIKRLYTDLKVIFKIGKLKVEILQEVGVKQGDNMAPVLFLFLMSAFSEILEATWEREGIQRVEFMRESDETYEEGQIFRHNVHKCRRSTNVVFFIVDNTIYVDDTAVPFTSREELCKGMP